MTALPEGGTVRPKVTPLEAFSGPIGRTKTGLLYSAGLAIVAFGMVLLPLIYVALTMFTAWAVALHLKYDTWILDGPSGRGSFYQLLLYLAPAGAGVILVGFMVKPFFAAKAKPPELFTLDPAKEPLLFAFVQRICSLVGAPMPCRVDVNCQVNASASLKRGLWRKDLVLTIGLPLASGLNMQQFAGVLAHEFGHFAQGTAMRLTYIIRKINFWFARVVYERDSWDRDLEQGARTLGSRIGLILHAARGCIWLTRRILWALMHVGHAISCFMLRQMEYDADSYEAKLAGSDAFEFASLRLRFLNAATQSAFEDLRQGWASKRLPENLPLLIGHKANSLPAEVQRKLATARGSEKTRWFHTHPSDADRIRKARRLNEPGVFCLTDSATRLFSDFEELSKKVTLHLYEKLFKLEFTEQNLMSAEEILRESAASAETEAMVRKYYGSINISLKPLLAGGELPPIADDQTATEQWHEVQQATDKLRAEAEKFSAECVEQHRRLASLVSAHSMAKAGFWLKLGAFGLPPGVTDCADQELGTRLALEEAQAELLNRLAKLEPFIVALRERVTLALRLGQNSNALSSKVPTEGTELAQLLAAVEAEIPYARQIDCRRLAFALLVQNRANHSEPAVVDAAAAELAEELRSLIDGIQERLNHFAYPFAHASGRLTVAEYARSEIASEDVLQRLYPDSEAHVDRLFALHYRLIGKVLTQAAAAETSLEKSEAV